jgi:hypothetical protein
MWNNPIIISESIKKAYEIWRNIGLKDGNSDAVKAVKKLYPDLVQCHYNRQQILRIFSRGDEFYVKESLNGDLNMKSMYTIYDIFDIAHYIEWGGDW